MTKSPPTPAPESADKPIMSLTATVAPDNVIEIVLADGGNVIREFKTADTWAELKEGVLAMCDLWEESERERLAARAAISSAEAKS